MAVGVTSLKELLVQNVFEDWTTMISEGVESDPHQKMIHMGKSEIDRHIRKVIHIPIGKVITVYYLVKS